MSAIDVLFHNLRAAKRKALMPFVTAGDPDLQFTSDLLRTLVARGSSLCELGIPYSDPVADGPVIQSSYTRALQHKVKLSGIFEMLGRTMPELKAPVVSMVSYSIIYRHGLEAYVTHARKAGLAGAIVPDLPAEESSALAEICRRQDFSLVQLIAPTTPRERALRIAERASGFIYYVSVTGITGERSELPAEILDNVAWLRGQTPLPICIGFGISRAEHVRMLAPVADGLIVGSAIVRRIADASSRPRGEVLREIGDYAAELIAAMEE
jgi:tryptophan synthase alpha chain